MPTRFANTIDNDPIYALRAMCDKNGLDFTQYYAKLTDLPAAQVQADWNESDNTSLAYILNKPDIANVPAVTSNDDGKVLKASYSGGTGSYSWETESGGSSLPASTSADEGKVLTVDSSGDPQWSDVPEGTPENVVLTYGTSTWADFTAALATNSAIFCDAGSGRYAVLAYKADTFVEFQYVRTINDTQWPLSSNGYNCEVYKFTLDNTNAWSTSSVPVAFKPVTGNGIKLYSNANRELQFAVEIPVYTDGNNSILWLGANGSLSIASSLFASKSITKTYTSPKAGGPVYTSTGSTSSTYFAIGNRYNNDCDQTFDNETIGITITGDISSSMEADRTKLIRWNSDTSLTLDGDLSVKYGLFYYDTFQTSTPFKAAAEPKLIVELKDCGTLLAANRYLSGIFMHPPLSKAVNNAIIPKGAKFLTAFYTVVGGVQYFFGAMLNPYGNANLSITSTMTGSVATLISVPTSSSQDAGKVLTVNSSGDPEWATPSSSQSQADWNQSDSTAADYIKNKPTINNVPASTSADEGKVLTVDSNGDPVWDTPATPSLSSLNTAGITDIQVVNALPASPVSTVLYLIPET